MISKIVTMNLRKELQDIVCNMKEQFNYSNDELQQVFFSSDGNCYENFLNYSLSNETTFHCSEQKMKKKIQKIWENMSCIERLGWIHKSKENVQ